MPCCSTILISKKLAFIGTAGIKALPADDAMDEPSRAIGTVTIWLISSNCETLDRLRCFNKVSCSKTF